MFDRLAYLMVLEAYYLQMAAGVTFLVCAIGLVIGLVLWRVVLHQRCGPLCNGLHDKPGKVWGLTRGTTIGGGLAGLLAYFFWLPVLAMNILFAAVLFDIFFGGGKRMTPPWAPEAGKYYAAALTAAALLAVVESFTAILLGILGKQQHGQVDKDGDRGFDPRAPLFLFLVVMIIFETWMAVWRSSLMSAGQAGLPTVWEGVLKMGPIIAGLMGAIIPIGEMMLAYAVAEWLITPWVAVTISGGLWGLAGWHSAGLPGAVTHIKREAGSLKRDTEGQGI